MRDILKDLWKKKILVLICLLFCTGTGTITGYKNSNFYDRISAKDKVKIEEYYEKLNEYEQNVKETEESIELVNTKIKDLQKYIDNSILMKLNPDNIYVADIYFATESLIKETDFFIDKYWSEIISISTHNEIYIISIMQSTKERMQEAINSIVNKIQSEYKISAPEISCYIKVDENIVNKQKECIDNLSGYINNKTELENSLKGQMSLTTKFKSEAKPKALSEKELRPISIMFRYALFGLIAGILGLISLFTVRRIL